MDEESFTSRFRLRRPRKTQATSSSRSVPVSGKRDLYEDILEVTMPLTPLADSATSQSSSSTEDEDESMTHSNTAALQRKKARRKSFPDNADFESAPHEQPIRGPSTRNRPQWRKKRIQPTTSDDEDAQLVGKTDEVDLAIFSEHENFVDAQPTDTNNPGHVASNQPAHGPAESPPAPDPEPYSPPWNLAHLRKKPASPAQIVEHQTKGILDFVPLRRATIPLHHSRTELIQRAQPTHTKRFLKHPRETTFGSDQPSQKQRKQAAAGHKHLHSLKRIPYMHEEHGSDATRTSEDELAVRPKQARKRRKKEKAGPRAAASFVPLEMVAADDPDVNYRVEKRKDTPAKHIKAAKKSKRKPKPLPKNLEPLAFGPQREARRKTVALPQSSPRGEDHFGQLDHTEEQLPSVHLPTPPPPPASIRIHTPASVAREQPIVYSSVEKARDAADNSLVDHEPQFAQNHSMHEEMVDERQHSGFAPELDLQPFPTIRQRSLSLDLPGLALSPEDHGSLHIEDLPTHHSDEQQPTDQEMNGHETTDDDEPTPSGPSDPWHSHRNGHVLVPNTQAEAVMQESDVGQELERSITSDDPIETDGYEGDLEADCTVDEYFARYNNDDFPPAGQAVSTFAVSDAEPAMNSHEAQPRKKKKKRILIAPIDDIDEALEVPAIPTQHPTKRRKNPTAASTNFSPVLEQKSSPRRSGQNLACSASARIYLRQRQTDPRSSSQPVASHFSYRGGFRSEVLSGKQAVELFRPANIIVDAGTARQARVRTITTMEQLRG